MRTLYLIITIIFYTSSAYGLENDCSQFDKLSKMYAKCIASKAKKGLEDSGLKSKFNKFKKSKTLSDLLK